MIVPVQKFADSGDLEDGPGLMRGNLLLKEIFLTY
jgi:hypothetical protein